MERAGGTGTGRSTTLDLLRALAIVLVLGRHLGPSPEENGAILQAVTTVWYRGGWIGVDLFFVLSGFLVSGLLFREYRSRGAVDVKRFLVRRGFKIYPAFWVLLAATIGVRIFRHEVIPTRPLLGELLFLQNYLTGLWNHTWSLAVEEHFYLLLALGVWWRLRVRRTGPPFEQLPLLFLVVAAICVALRVQAGWAGEPFDATRQLFPTHLRVDSLFFGVVIAYYWHFRGWDRNAGIVRAAPLLVLLGAVAIAPAFLLDIETTRWLPTYGLTLLYLGCGSLLVGMLHLPSSEGGWQKGLARIGVYSYSIYLWHRPVRAWGVPLVEKLVGHDLEWIQFAPLYLVGSVVMGMLMASLIEYPVLRIRDRILPSRAPIAVVGGGLGLSGPA